MCVCSFCSRKRVCLNVAAAAAANDNDNADADVDDDATQSATVQGSDEIIADSP